MRDRRIVYILILVFAAGMAVTFCTGYLTGSFSSAGQVTVSLAGKDETGAEPETAQESSGIVSVTTAAVMEVGPGGLGDVNMAEPGGDAAAPAGPGADGAEAPEMQDGAAEPGQDGGGISADSAEDAGESSRSGGAEDGQGSDGPAAEAAENGAALAEADSDAADDVSAPAEDAFSPVAPVSEDGPAVTDAASAVPDARQDPKGISLQPGESVYAEYDSEAAAAAAGDGGPDGGAGFDENNPYYIRLTELDAQIERSRQEQDAAGAANVASSLARNAAANELKLWDGELNTIYNEILKHLDEKQTQELVEAERQWMKNRDAAAVEAARNSAGGSRESVEYTASLAESTRSRAYELVRLYGYLLTE